MTRRSLFGTLFAIPLIGSVNSGAVTETTVNCIVKPRKLKYPWTMETGKDLLSVHGLDVDIKLDIYKKL